MEDEDYSDDEDENDRKLNDSEEEGPAFAGKPNTRYPLPPWLRTRSTLLQLNARIEARMDFHPYIRSIVHSGHGHPQHTIPLLDN